uniref:Prostate transmembrane protein, androgen induced 1 n=1 Tax=Cynoglossus semilaevis TaxID=244447 RepID=A0A3P8X1C2_CYNSE
MFNLMGVLNTTAANVSCTCNCQRFTSLQSMEITQLEFVQILVIVVVMMVMVVVITCLLNHYRLSARSLLTRHSGAHRRHLPLANEGGLWSSEGTAPNAGLSEPNVQPHRFQHTYAPCRFQPTYPYLPQSLIDLPPTIALSDGEEPPPYQEQQMDLNRESVRAPPNRTVFDSHPIDLLQAPPPSVNPGLSVFEAQEASRQQNPGAGLEGAPPAYSEVMGHYYHPGSVTPGHRHRTVSHGQLPPSSLVHGLLRPTAQQQGSMNSRKAKEKSQKPQQV